MFRPLLCLLVASFLLLGCSSGNDPLPAEVREAWERYREEPTENTYLGFIQANRAAARAHGNPDDAQGVLHQVLALEAQSEQAERRGDLQLAQAVVVRIDEIAAGGVIDTYDDVVPGARERLLAARERVDVLLR